MFFRPIICHRLFFALRPPPALADQIAQSAPWFGAKGRCVWPEHLHITLDILHDYPSFPTALADAMVAIGEKVRSAPAAIVLDEANGRGGTVVLRPGRRNAALAALYQEINDARTDMSVAQRRGYRFSPHMTLSRGATRDFRMAIRPISWRAEEFVLIHSLVGRTEHRVLGRWRLHEGAGPQPDLFATAIAASADRG